MNNPAQAMLPLLRALPPRARCVRSTFRPGTPSQPYRLPHEVRDRLVAALQPFRNREAAFALAHFLGRFWSMPGRLTLPFPIVREALADREDLGLTEARIRRAIKTLEAIGFLDRWMTSGSSFHATAHGLRRKPVPFTFGAEYMPLFLAANQHAAAARGRRPPAGRSQGPARPQRPPARPVEARPLKSPEGKSAAEPLVITGDLPRLSEAALKAIGIAGAKPGWRS
jgi:hypothetical protein